MRNTRLAGGAATALSALVLLVALHALQGPTLLGRHSPIVEALALLAAGCGYGLWAASRPARRSDGPLPPG